MTRPRTIRRWLAQADSASSRAHLCESYVNVGFAFVAEYAACGLEFGVTAMRRDNTRPRCKRCLCAQRKMRRREVQR